VRPAQSQGEGVKTPIHRENRILRVEFSHDANGTVLLRLQGRLVGVYAEDARITMARYQVPQKVVVELTELTFIDSSGEDLLLWLDRIGTEFIADNVYCRAVCERNTQFWVVNCSRPSHALVSAVVRSRADALLGNTELRLATLAKSRNWRSFLLDSMAMRMHFSRANRAPYVMRGYALVSGVAGNDT
jgi:hypothetical protein